MKLSKYIQELHLNPYMWILNSHPEVEIYSFKPLPKEKKYDEQMLYIGYISEFDFSGTTEKVNFLCLNDISLPLTKEKLLSDFPCANLITTTWTDSLRSLFDIASEVLLSETRYTSQINRMVTAFNSNQGLQHLVDEAYAITKSPIIVMDSSYKILAMYRDYMINQRPDLETQRELGYLTEQNLARMKLDKIYEKMREAKYPLYDKESDTSYGWLNTLVYIHGVEVAGIGMMEYDHPFTYYDSEFLHFLCQLVSWEMQKNNFYKDNRGVMHSIFLSELLENKIPNRKIASFRQKQLNWRNVSYMNVLTIFSNGEPNFKQKAEIMAIHVQQYLPDSRWVIYNSNLVILILRNTTDVEDFMPGSIFYEYLKTNEIYGILSNCYTDLLETRKHYEQTISIQNLRTTIEKKPSIYIYSDYVFYHIAQIISEKYDLKDFYHPAIIKMLEYDANNKTCYIDTLSEYLLHIDNPSLSSSNLFIHKNTFFYRMNKIREIFQLDLNDGRERLKLHLTLEFLKLG